MQTRYPGAEWRPLSTHQTEPKIGVPRVLVFHTMVGGLRGTESMFRRNGYSGNESTFGLGGPTDGAELDGALWQWGPLDRQADAQHDGNAYATSIEMSDGGTPSRPLSRKQIDKLVNFSAWWCRQTGNPPVLVRSPSGRGFGYHRLFRAWNNNGHTCPGDVRIRQIKGVIIPRVADMLARSHVVRAGETLQSIAIKWYTRADQWEKIYAANRATIGRNPNHISPGMKLRIP